MRKGKPAEHQEYSGSKQTTEPTRGKAARAKEMRASQRIRPVFVCDRCGFEMVERQCKVICPNCGSRYDCSDLSIYFD